MIAYLMRNRTNGMSYVGATKHRIEARLSRHWNRAFRELRDEPLANAIREFGRDAFEILILGVTESSERLAEMEREFIRQYNTMVPNGYNLTSGGLGTPGRSWSKSNRQKQEDWRRYGYSQETRRKMSLHNGHRQMVLFNGRQYHSIAEAGRANGLTSNQMQGRIRKNPNYVTRL